MWSRQIWSVPLSSQSITTFLPSTDKIKDHGGTLPPFLWKVWGFQSTCYKSLIELAIVAQRVGFWFAFCNLLPCSTNKNIDFSCFVSRVKSRPFLRYCINVKRNKVITWIVCVAKWRWWWWKWKYPENDDDYWWRWKYSDEDDDENILRLKISWWCL